MHIIRRALIYAFKINSYALILITLMSLWHVGPKNMRVELKHF